MDYSNKVKYSLVGLKVTYIKQSTYYNIYYLNLLVYNLTSTYALFQHHFLSLLNQHHVV